MPTNAARNYNAATPLALYQLGKGNCYAPDCHESTIRFLDGEPFTNAHIAHIRGAKPGSARYDESMTDPERAAFANLLLLCTAHHELVDQRHPERYPVELLHKWKSEREKAVEGRHELSGVNEFNLKAMLEGAMARYQPPREVSLDVEGGVLVDGGMVRMPLQRMRHQIKLNRIAGALTGDPYVLLFIRNTGYVMSSVEDVTVRCRFNHDIETHLSGRDDLPGQNPKFPATLEVGHALTWYIALETFQHIWQFDLPGQRFTDFRFEVTLGSGEVQWTEYQTSHRVRPIN